MLTWPTMRAEPGRGSRSDEMADDYILCASWIVGVALNLGGDLIDLLPMAAAVLMVSELLPGGEHLSLLTKRRQR